MSFNVWYGNVHYTNIAELIQEQVGPDVVNLQEAVTHQPAAILEALNQQGVGEWKLANTFSTDHFWCGLNAYRADRWDLEWHKEVPYQGSRGICGARLRRKSDGRRMCVWGTHPTWFNGGPASSAEEAVRAGAAAMKECSQGSDSGIVSALMCDCNTADTGAVSHQLFKSTGWQWKVAHADGYDQIYIQTGTGIHFGGGAAADGARASVASPVSGHTIAGASGGRGCQAACQNPKWAGADHPPVYADVRLE